MELDMRLIGIAFVLVGFVLGEYDYVVVGGGTGGGTLAVELAKAGFRTLLMEAGPDHYGVNQTTPGLMGNSIEDPAVGFDFQVKHYENNKTYYYPRVGALGGCSIHNAMISMLPNMRDFQLMEELTGDSGWSEANMRKYFRRLEKNQYRIRPQEKVHGFDGWMQTSYIDIVTQLKLDLNLAGFALATVPNPFNDINGRDNKGNLNTNYEQRAFVPVAIDFFTKKRANFPHHIKSAAKRYPLEIWTDAFVTKVLFEGNTAIGVEYKKGKYLYKASPLNSQQNRNQATTGTVMAKKEIILSAGTFNTPQILMLSGVGDQQHLNEFNIPLVSHVPGVGRNLMDRYEIPIVHKYNSNFALLKDCKFKADMKDPCYADYVNNINGPYASTGVFSTELHKSSPALKEPDLSILHTLSDFHGYFHGFSKNFAKRLDSSSHLILKAHTNNTNGRVKLRSSDPFDTPNINFHYFSDGDGDLDILVNAVKNLRDALKAIPLPRTELFPGSHIQSHHDIRQYIKENAWGHHACCTAKMGTTQDPTAVIDAKFRVRGTRHLRVVDMSIFPKIPGYFPATYVHMMAMKAAQDIIQTS